MTIWFSPHFGPPLIEELEWHFGRRLPNIVVESDQPLGRDLMLLRITTDGHLIAVVKVYNLLLCKAFVYFYGFKYIGYSRREWCKPGHFAERLAKDATREFKKYRKRCADSGESNDLEHHLYWLNGDWD